MKELNNDQLSFLTIEIDELKELVNAIKEIQVPSASLYKLAHDKAERIYRTFKNDEEPRPITLPTAGKKPFAFAKVEQPVEHLQEDLMAINEAMGENLNAPIDEEEDPRVFTQSIIIQTPTAPSDLSSDSIIINEKIANIATSLSDALEKRSASDLRKALTLNDRFRFQRELFSGSAERMDRTLAEINMLQTMNEAINYVKHNIHPDLEDEVLADFLKLLEKRFN